MAGDWIPMRMDLSSDPAVIRLSSLFDNDVHTVVGRLHKLWSWANQHLTDGHAQGVTEEWIDRHIERAGFAQIMVEVGWLEVTDNGIIIPNFDVWNSQSAKKRLLTARRVAQHKASKGNAASVTKTLPERYQSVTASLSPLKEKETEREKSPPGPPSKERDKERENSPPTHTACAREEVIPESLKTTSFLEAWSKWQEYRSERRKKLTPSTVVLQLKKLEKLGPEKAVQCIEQSICHGWQGLFEPEAEGRFKTNGHVETVDERCRRLFGNG